MIVDTEQGLYPRPQVRVLRTDLLNVEAARLRSVDPACDVENQGFVEIGRGHETFPGAESSSQRSRSCSGKNGNSSPDGFRALRQGLSGLASAVGPFNFQAQPAAGVSPVPVDG